MEARANGTSLNISTKQSVEICRLLRYKNIEKAKRVLENVMLKKQAVPYLRYNKEIPHRKGIQTTGRYPIKASKEILNLLKNAEANAKNKGMTSKLYISHISADKGSNVPRHGRKIGTQTKNTHVNIILKEQK